MPEKMNLIEFLLAGERKREKLGKDMKDSYQNGYVSAHNEYAFLKGRQKAMDSIKEENKPGMLKRGAVRTIENPQRLNPGAVETWHHRRQNVIRAVKKSDALPKKSMANYRGKVI